MITDTLRKNPFDELVVATPERRGQDQHHLKTATHAMAGAMISGTGITTTTTATTTTTLDTIGSCFPSQAGTATNTTVYHTPQRQEKANSKHEMPTRRPSHQRHLSDSSTILVNGTLFANHLHPPPPPQPVPLSSSVVHTPSSVWSGATKTTGSNSHGMTSSSSTGGGGMLADPLSLSGKQLVVPHVVSTTSSGELGGAASQDEEDGSLHGLGDAFDFEVDEDDEDEEDIERDMEELFGIPRGNNGRNNTTPRTSNGTHQDLQSWENFMQFGHNSNISNGSTPADFIFEHHAATTPPRPRLGSAATGSSKKLLGKTSRPKAVLKTFRSKSNASSASAGDGVSHSQYVAPVFLSRHASIGGSSTRQLHPPPGSSTVTNHPSAEQQQEEQQHRTSASLDASELCKIAAELSVLKPSQNDDASVEQEGLDTSTSNRRMRVLRRRSVGLGNHRKSGSLGDMGKLLEAMNTDGNTTTTTTNNNSSSSGKVAGSSSQRRILVSPSLTGPGGFLKKSTQRLPPKSSPCPPPPPREVLASTEESNNSNNNNNNNNKGGYNDVQIRTCEADPAPHQMELPCSDDLLVHSKICALMEEYTLVDPHFDFGLLQGMSRLEMNGFLNGTPGAVAEADLLGTTTPTTTTTTATNTSSDKVFAPQKLSESHHRPIVSNVLRITDDLVVEGFRHCPMSDGAAKTPANGIEVAIFFSERQRQFIVAYRGPAALQAKAIRNRDAKKAKNEENLPPTPILTTPGKRKQHKGNNSANANANANNATTTTTTSRPPNHHQQQQQDMGIAGDATTSSHVLFTFRDAYWQSAHETYVFEMLDGLAVRTPFCDVVFTGHSFGATLATLAATRYARCRPMMRVSCHGFACPKMGTTGFRHLVNSLPNLKVVRVEYGCDTSGHAPDGPHWTHVGHTITVGSISNTTNTHANANTTHSSSSSSSTPPPPPPTTKQPSCVVRAYRFDQNREGNSSSGGGGLRLSRLAPGFAAKQEKEDQKIRSYVGALERVTSLGIAWPVDFVGNTGKGIVRGFNQETRLVV